MKLGTLAFVASSLALGLATLMTPAKAQGPMWDVVHVNLPYTVNVGDRTLQPGEYTIQQLRDNGGGSRVLLIYSEKGMKFETSAMTIPALDPDTARDTKITLHHIGNNYYFDKVWIQGKDYGYEFPLPGGVKSREKEQVTSVAANYSTTPAATNTATSAATSAATNATTKTATTATNSAATTAASRAATTATTAATTATTARNTMPPTTTATTQPQTSTSTATTARSTVPASTTASTTPATSASSSADRSMNDQSPASTPASTPSSMPSTSAGWLMMVLGGGSLSGMGLALRRKR